MTDISQIRCFHCQQFGHLKRHCPHRSKPKSRKPGPAESRPPSEQDKLAAYQRIDLTRVPDDEIADYPARAAEARALLGGSTDPAEGWVVTPFRKQFGIPPRPEAVLREMARQQVDEYRAQAS